MGLNVWLFRFVSDFAGRWPALDIIAIFFSEYVWLIMLAVVAGKFLMDRQRHKDMAIVSIGSAVIARGIIVSIIKWFYDHPRPDMVIKVNALLAGGDTVNSFPSGHTTFVFALAAGVYFYDKKLGRWLLAAAALVGLARIYAGVHWPFDILAGAVLGVLSAYVFNRVYRKKERE
ncbi:MAG: hypothetical protein A2941_00510 [Candidatus Yanofskybacteria bacterium RIFCSPLOWO2_01_FULL_49_17]|uniref:Phosphatidic acid phosphatase type 2/haloperoxidase domain-containing protein n=1 Tax=Candidatus Yanofskybacteria bacterium RIFCSPLOWO2_01_FULL_49_17 TaxID=1802700 RepID=A0A1F8GPI0_9BACT|nr:MAG: hypothetical protein A2941_00510 [Candidatus Yanofskybacteria bacterium RIFCSPLOWO2_01_FULL_49_17]